MNGFKKFLLRGNVVDLAIAVVIGAAFTAVINALVAGFITPLIAAIFGKPNLDQVATFSLNGAQFSIGLILTALVNFLLVAAAVYFAVVLPVNTLLKRYQKAPEPDAPTKACPECTSRIPLAARRCMFCTATLEETSPIAPRPSSAEEGMPTHHS
jgi:large conductance mechanosensitive channel